MWDKETGVASSCQRQAVFAEIKILEHCPQSPAYIHVFAVIRLYARSLPLIMKA